MTYDIEKISQAIEWPIEDWPGNCYAVAVALLESGCLEPEHEDAVARYGHWLGSVSSDCEVEQWVNSPSSFQRHGWLEVPGAAGLAFECVCGHMVDEHADSGFFRGCDCCECDDFEGVNARPTIIDPTRWVFEAKKPYIYVGAPCGNYDAGGNRHRMRTLGPPPVYDPTAPRGKTAIWSVCGKAHRFTMDRILGGSHGITQEQERWLANADPAIFGVHAKAIFTALVKAGNEAWIPIDNRRAVLGDKELV